MRVGLEPYWHYRCSGTSRHKTSICNCRETWEPRGLMAAVAQGFWWHLRRRWWLMAWKHLVCFWRGHEWAVVEYRIHRVGPPFDAVECKHCSERAGILELPE